MKKTILITVLLLLFVVTFANNVQVSSVTYNGTTQIVSFTLSWENSWDLTGGSPPGNHDAIWVFIKCQTNNLWLHGQLSTNPLSHTLGNSLALAQPGAMNPYGVLIKKSSLGFGNINGGHSVSLQLSSPSGISAIQVFAIEMVYITEGTFSIGRSTLASQNEAFNGYTITSENTIPNATLGLFPEVPATFPKGYKAFYAMKYEISQGQYTDFLNTLTRTQQQQRVEADISGTTVTNRYVMTNQPVLTDYNHIVCGTNIPATGSIGFSSTVPEKACNYLSAADLRSYLDWAALRPMTELEFEKVCRGFDPLVDNQYIWSSGASSLPFPPMTVIDADLPTETTTGSDPAVNTQQLGNISCMTYGNGRLMRCGFAGSKPTSRELAGATYFGVMEMAGNVGEMVYSVFENQFTGVNGNGNVNDVPDFWADYNKGLQSRGGCYATLSLHKFKIESRNFSSSSSLLGANNFRESCSGGRGALSL